MAGRYFWKPLMTRVIFTYIDEQKGEDSLFLRDLPAALKEIRTRLATSEDPDIRAAMTDQQLTTKLYKQAHQGGISQANMHKVYREGTEALRLERMQNGVFTKEEIEASKQKHSQQPQPSKKRKAKDEPGDAPAKRPRCDVKRSDPEADYQPKGQKRKATTGEDTSRAKKAKLTIDVPVKCDKCEKHNRSCDFGKPCRSCKQKKASCSYTSTLADPQQVVGDSDEESELSPAKSVSELAFQPPSAYATRIQQSSKQIATISSSNAMTFACEHCEQVFSGEGALLSHKQTHSSPAFDGGAFTCETAECGASFNTDEALTRHRKAHEEFDELKDLTSSMIQGSDGEEWQKFDDSRTAWRGELDIIRTMRYKHSGMHEDVGEIKTTMEYIQEDIFEATTRLFLRAKMDGRKSVTLAENTHEKALVELLEVLFGPWRSGDPGDLAERWKQPESELQLFDLVVGIIGAAVTEWALKPAPQGDLERGVLRHVSNYLKSKSESLEDHVMENGVRQYLEEYVEPRVGEAAHNMAAELFNLLRHFIPQEATAAYQKWPLTGAAEPDSPDDQRPDVSPLSDLSDSPSQPIKASTNTQWPGDDEVTPQQRFLDDLTDKIFRKALQLRVNMEKMGNAKYRFSFPWEGEALDFDEHTAHDRVSGSRMTKMRICEESGVEYKDNMEAPERTIMIGLFPAAIGMYRKCHMRNEEWREDEVIISKSHVLLYNPRKEKELL